jgi:hypothetical protein
MEAEKASQSFVRSEVKLSNYDRWYISFSDRSHSFYDIRLAPEQVNNDTGVEDTGATIHHDLSFAILELRHNKLRLPHHQ